MRLYSIYYLCKKYRDVICKCEITERNITNGKVIEWKNWEEYQKVLVILGKVTCLKKMVNEVYEKVPVLVREKKDSYNKWRNLGRYI